MDKQNLPPDMATYLAGVPEESGQFEFFIGDWDCQTTRFDPYTGNVVSEYPGRWHAEYLFNKRIVFDTFTRYLPSGEEAGVGVQVRTFCPASNQWEMTQIDAHQPRTYSPFTARWVDGEMKLSADCDGWSFRGRFYDIRPDSWKWEGEGGADGQWAPMIRVTAVRRDIPERND